MYHSCTTEKSAQRQRLLTQAMLEALKTRTLQEISVSEICLSSGISRKQFYQLFGDKMDVVVALLDQTILDYELFQADPSVAPGELSRCLAYWKSQQALLDVLSRNNMSALLIERCLHHTLHEESSLLDTFGVDNPEYSQEMMMFYISGIFSVVMHWHSTGYARSIEQMHDLLAVIMRKTPVKPW